MKIERIKINNIPSLIWGEKSKKVFIAVHGNMSNKKDEVIKILANRVVSKGYQVLSFDLPEHGERKDDTNYLCKVQNCVKDLNQIIEYARKNYAEINLWACSMGAYFSLLAYKDEDIKQCLFLSPVVNMKVIIDNMMLWSNTTEEKLKEKQEIKTDCGQTLYWDYYEYVNNNPITNWNKKTFVLYGNKDNLQDENIIKDFCNNFNCSLSILENGEHYFHTEEQLKLYGNWIDKTIT
ncbi:MAG: alpha/beta hydrolase [Clostridia bacterium]|nr:alpha/beta hydrolase [Clostridia bacterium]